MDPKTTANSCESDRQNAAATDEYVAADSAPERINTPADHPVGQHAQANEQATDSQRRVSLDPMRSTDRYRLVQPSSSVLKASPSRS